MADTYLGRDLNPALDDDEISYSVEGGVLAGDTFYTHITMNANNLALYQVGWIVVYTNYGANYFNVGVGNTSAATKVTGTTTLDAPFQCWVNYRNSRNYIVITMPRPELSTFTLRVRFVAIKNRTALYTAVPLFIYDGYPKSCVSNMHNCSISSGVNVATSIGNYTVVLDADGAEYADTYYFEENNAATSYVPIAWQIVNHITNTTKIFINNNWVDGSTYIYSNGQWVEACPHIYINGEWKETTS